MNPPWTWMFEAQPCRCRIINQSYKYLRLRFIVFIDGFQLQFIAWNKKGVQEVQRRLVLSWYCTVKNVTSLVNFCHIMLACMGNRLPFAVSAERKPASWVEINPKAPLVLLKIHLQLWSGAPSGYLPDGFYSGVPWRPISQKNKK